jgi:predicted metal-binding protein
MDLNQARALVQRYQYGILVDIKLPPELVAGPRYKELKSTHTSTRKLFEIVSKIESEAFHDGYHLALGFGAGTCKPYYCPDMECSALTKGQPCRHPLKTRPSMEGIGMDVFSMATKVGWAIYPIGETTLPTTIPHGHRIALILIY